MIRPTRAKSLTSLLFSLIFLSSSAWASPDWKWEMPALASFISDTLNIDLPEDTADVHGLTSLEVMDSRDLGEQVIGIRQTKKYKYIPVDQYLALEAPLGDLFSRQFAKDSIEQTGSLDISELILWYDGSQVMNKGLVLSAYATLQDTLDQTVSDWIWEIRVKREKKEADTLYLGRVLQEWAKAQSLALKEQDFNTSLYPHLFRRQLMTWSEIIIMADGFATNIHFTLDFPPDQEGEWTRGSPGLFYRRSSVHESIAIGGMDQQWYRRLSQDWLIQTSATYRFGFNNFERAEFKNLGYENLFYVNVSGQASLEYRPVYHKGVFGGLGMYAGYNILPDVVPQTELGLLLRIGVVLP